MEIKLIALDLDGTTLRSKSVLSKETKEALEAAIRKGVHVVIATGRTFSALPDCIFEIEGLRYAITSNGAHTTDLSTNQTIYSNCADGNAIEKVRELLMANRQYPVEVFTEGRAYIDQYVYDDVKENGSTYMDAEYIMDTRNPVPSVYEFMLDNKDQIENINIHFEHLEDKRKFNDILRLYEGITVTSSVPHNIEIGGETTSKATAIFSLCHMLGIEDKDVMAVGDSPNDMAMIKAAGLGVAVGNAVEEVKAIADFITLSNSEDGVAHAVKKFVLEDC
ncbi:MAG: HAD family phosphatase [Firmicutes bacterium]|nr:HAD family phosphatase [Bacillota bacterium]